MFPFVMRRDGPPELVIRRKHPWLVSCRRAMPVLSRRRDEIGEPVQELKRREFDDAAGSWPRGLVPTPGPDPVGGLVPWQHVADLSDAVGWAADQGESLQREGGAGAIPQQVLQTLKIAGHIAVY
jgi:hypothetical protein